MAAGKAISKEHQVEISTYLAEAAGVLMWLRVLYHIMRDTGLRLSEAICLPFGVFWEGGVLVERLQIDGRIRKGEDPLSYAVTLSPETRRLIQKYANTMNEAGKFGAEKFMFPGCSGAKLGYLHRSTAYSHLKKLFRSALGPEAASQYTAHSLRRTKATDVFRSSRDVVACQYLLGHKFIGSTTRYIQISANDIAAVERKVYRDMAAFQKSSHPKRVWRAGHAVAVQRELFGDLDLDAQHVTLSDTECKNSIEVAVAERRKDKQQRQAERFNGGLPRPQPRQRPPTPPPFWSSSE